MQEYIKGEMNIESNYKGVYVRVGSIHSGEGFFLIKISLKKYYPLQLRACKPTTERPMGFFVPSLGVGNRTTRRYTKSCSGLMHCLPLKPWVVN